MTRVVQPLGGNPMAKQIDISIPQDLLTTTQWLDDWMVCRWANDTII